MAWCYSIVFNKFIRTNITIYNAAFISGEQNMLIILITVFGTFVGIYLAEKLADNLYEWGYDGRRYMSWDEINLDTNCRMITISIDGFEEVVRISVDAPDNVILGSITILRNICKRKLYENISKE